MKLITAVLRPDCLEAIHEALDPNEARILSAAPVVDDRYSRETYRGAELRQPRPRLRLEVVVPNDLAVQDAIDAIERAVQHAGTGDGFVIVTPVDDLVRLPRALPATGAFEAHSPEVDARTEAMDLHRAATWDDSVNASKGRPATDP